MGIHQAKGEQAATQQETITEENSYLDKFSQRARHRCGADKKTRAQATAAHTAREPKTKITCRKKTNSGWENPERQTRRAREQIGYGPTKNLTRKNKRCYCATNLKDWVRTGTGNSTNHKKMNRCMGNIKVRMEQENVSMSWTMEAAERSNKNKTDPYWWQLNRVGFYWWRRLRHSAAKVRIASEGLSQTETKLTRRTQI
jgi:hypothetical protein